MSLFIKLCGLRSIEDIEFAAGLGVEAIGLVMTPSVRQVDFDTARRLVDSVPEGLISVGVFYHPEAELVRRARDDVGFDWIQSETKNLLGISGITPFPVVHDGQNLESDVAAAFAASVLGRILVESSGRGGKGEHADWGRVSMLERTQDVVLAGGLNALNISEAIELVRPGGVDVSSGIETAPGVKDLGLMTEFVEIARATDREMAR